MSGSVVSEQEGAEVKEAKRRFLMGRCQGYNDVVERANAYCPRYLLDEYTGDYWVRRRLDVNGIGNAYFDVTANYSTLVPAYGGGDGGGGGGGGGNFVPGTIAWDTTGHTEHITQAFDESVFPDSEPSFEAAINVSGNSVEGIDVVRPAMRYSETWILPVSTALDPSFVNAVYRLTGTVNANQFRAFSPGEALFMGGRGQWQGDQPYVAVSFEFECRPNIEVILSPGLPGVMFQKKGWEYYWIRYQTDSQDGTLIRRPQAAYLNRIYEQKPWGDLQIVSAAPPGRPTRPSSGTPTSSQSARAFLAR
jgi:hypothetical protein